VKTISWRPAALKKRLSTDLSGFIVFMDHGCHNHRSITHHDCQRRYF
jgi:hypothetical protein